MRTRRVVLALAGAVAGVAVGGVALIALPGSDEPRRRWEYTAPNNVQLFCLKADETGVVLLGHTQEGAETAVVRIDGTTGGLVWRVSLPGRAPQGALCGRDVERMRERGTILVPVEDEGVWEVYGLDVETGKTRWRRGTAIRGSQEPQLRILPGLVLIGDAEEIIAVEVSSGDRKWSYATPLKTVVDPTTGDATVTSAGMSDVNPVTGKLLVLMTDGQFVVLDRLGRGSSPHAFDDDFGAMFYMVDREGLRVAVKRQAPGLTVAGIDEATGRTAWRRSLAGSTCEEFIPTATLIACSDGVVIDSKRRAVVRLSPRPSRGSRLLPFEASGVVLAVSKTSSAAYDVRSGRLMWTHPAPLDWGPEADGVAYSWGGKSIVAIDLARGVEKWTIDAAPIGLFPQDNRLLVLTNRSVEGWG